MCVVRVGWGPVAALTAASFGIFVRACAWVCVAAVVPFVACRRVGSVVLVLLVVLSLPPSPLLFWLPSLFFLCGLFLFSGLVSLFVLLFFLAVVSFVGLDSLRALNSLFGLDTFCVLVSLYGLFILISLNTHHALRAGLRVSLPVEHWCPLVLSAVSGGVLVASGGFLLYSLFLVGPSPLGGFLLLLLSFVLFLLPSLSACSPFPSPPEWACTILFLFSSPPLKLRQCFFFISLLTASPPVCPRACCYLLLLAFICRPGGEMAREMHLESCILLFPRLSRFPIQSFL